MSSFLQQEGKTSATERNVRVILRVILRVKEITLCCLQCVSVSECVLCIWFRGHSVHYTGHKHSDHFIRNTCTDQHSSSAACRTPDGSVYSGGRRLGGFLIFWPPRVFVVWTGINITHTSVNPTESAEAS